MLLSGVERRAYKALSTEVGVFPPLNPVNVQCRSTDRSFRENKELFSYRKTGSAFVLVNSNMTGVIFMTISLRVNNEILLLTLRFPTTPSKFYPSPPLLTWASLH